MKVSGLYKIECYIFKEINRYFDQKTLNIFFSNITHIGGATFSIALTLFFLILQRDFASSCNRNCYFISH